MNIDQNKAKEGQTVEKVWGTTRCLVRGHGFEVHYLEIVPGGYCSRHKHRGKWNQFFVRSGRLTVRYFDDNGNPTSAYHLNGGDILVVPPGQVHRFEAVDQCEATEIYWTDPVDPYDIDRIDEGGVMKNETEEVAA